MHNSNPRRGSHKSHHLLSHSRALLWLFTAVALNRGAYFFWEAIILLEKLALAMVVTAMQRFGAAAQIFAMLCVVFVSLLLQITCQPYGCRMLDTLQRGSLYVLNGTCLGLLLAALAKDVVASPDQADAVVQGALATTGVLNAGLVACFAYAMALEGRRMALATLDTDGKGRVTRRDVWEFVVRAVPPRLLRCITCGAHANRAGTATAV
jgi:hypothetical protein